MRKYILVFILFLHFVQCEKVNYYPDKEFEVVETKFLAHRGSGFTNIPENTLEAAIYGFERLDGIEVDIYLSKDRTLWLSHDLEVGSCGGKEYDCFPETYDSEIEELDDCLGDSLNFTKLEEIFKYVSENCPDKFIALDVKDWFPCKWTSLDILGIHKVIADKLIILANKYNVEKNLLVESQIATFLTRIKKNEPKISTYLTTFGDFERGMLVTLEGGFTGMSFKYGFDEEINVNHIDLIRKKGLKIMIWVINSEANIKETMLLNPDFIQTDNIEYVVENDLINGFE